jgi:transcription elongation factor Elf1
MDKLPFTCPICGRKTEHPLDALSEGAELTCPFCKLKLTLHGHMWQEVKRELEKIGAGVKGQGPGKNE